MIILAAMTGDPVVGLLIFGAILVIGYAYIRGNRK